MAEPSGSPARVVLVTAPDLAVGERLARSLVEAGLAACVNIVSSVRSIYRYEGRIEDESEVLLIAKTVARKVAALEELLEDEHPYDVPECVSLEPASVSPAYLAWLVESVSG